jgi:asparagine synthase (glutamine-hydrolysing)
MYTTGDGLWDGDFLSVCNKTDGLEWDLSSIMSILSYGYPLGDRTLFTQIRRKPWMSSIDKNGRSELMAIPSHGYIWKEPQEAARELFDLLCDEIEVAVKGVDDIYILLSGGLDSRIVAGVTRFLKEDGRIDANITAVTWGIEDSRDVQYARILAEKYGFSWEYAPLTQEHLKKNIDLMAAKLGGANWPIHLHRMDWFDENVESEAVVLAGSYGDSVGRAEFSRRTVLELLPIKPYNAFELLNSNAALLASKDAGAEIMALHQRAGNEADYVKYEYEQQCHYMRGLIAHTMSFINQSKHCTIYQAFTSPAVYSYMWSLHPAIRDDKIYREVLELIGRDVASIPWARNNKSMKGEADHSLKNLNPDYHDYRSWSINIFREEIARQGEEAFLANYKDMGFFDPNSLKRFFRSFSASDAAHARYGSHSYGVLVWLLSLNRLVTMLPSKPKSPHLSPLNIDKVAVQINNRSSLRRYLSSISVIRSTAGYIRRSYLRRASIKKFPPVRVEENN